MNFYLAKFYLTVAEYLCYIAMFCSFIQNKVIRWGINAKNKGKTLVERGRKCPAS